MGDFVYGKSRYGNCGEFVIVNREKLDYLEKAAREARAVIAQAAKAATVQEMGDHLNHLERPFWFDWETDAYEELLADALADETKSIAKES